MLKQHCSQLPSPPPQSSRTDRAPRFYRARHFPQVLGAILVSVIVCQIHRCIAVFVPQEGVYTVGEQGLAALRENGIFR